MAQDLAALAPSAIVCAAFLIGAGMLLRHELAPRRRARSKGDASHGEQQSDERDEDSES